MFRTVKALGGAIAATAIVALSSPAAFADDVADFYRNKTLTIVVGFGAGGTYGKYSIMLSQFLSKHIPGNPRVKVRHMPGAGGLKAMNYAYNVLPKDGTGMVMPVDTLIVSELLRPDKVKYKSRDFTWLGTAVQTNSVVAVRADSGVRSIRDLQNVEIIMGSTGMGSQTFLMPSMLNGLLGTRLKIVRGYKGARKIMLAMEQGEVQGIALTWGSWMASKPQWFKKGTAIPLLQIGQYREPTLPNVPMAIDLVGDADSRRIVKFMASMSAIGRGLAVPPKVPKARVDALRTAFDRTVRDRRFQSQAKRRKLDLSPASGEEIQVVVNDVMNVSPEIVARARAAIMGPGL